MSSRARVVDEEIRPYDWRGLRGVPAAAPQSFEAIVPPTALQPAVRDEQRLAEIERDAFAKGYESGQRTGAEAAAAEARGLLRRLAETIDMLAATKQDMVRRTERQVVELAMAIAKQILQREITADRALLLAMARVALDRLGDQEAATIRLHPDDYAAVQASPDPKWASEQVTVVADSIVEPGGCLVECAGGRMTVGLDGQFTELSRTLLGEPDADAR